MVLAAGILGLITTSLLDPAPRLVSISSASVTPGDVQHYGFTLTFKRGAPRWWLSLPGLEGRIQAFQLPA
jgi:hypothetical protein